MQEDVGQCARERFLQNFCTDFIRGCVWETTHRNQGTSIKAIFHSGYVFLAHWACDLVLLPLVVGKTSETIRTLLQAQILQGTPGVGCAQDKEGCQAPVPCTVGDSAWSRFVLVQLHLFQQSRWGLQGRGEGLYSLSEISEAICKCR